MTKSEIRDIVITGSYLINNGMKEPAHGWEDYANKLEDMLVKNNAALPHVSNSGNPLMHAKCDKCGRQILSWKNCGIASMYKNYDKDNFEYTGNIEQWVCNYCTAELGYDVD